MPVNEVDLCAVCGYVADLHQDSMRDLGVPGHYFTLKPQMNEADQRIKELLELGHTGEAHINREFYTLVRNRIGPLLEELEQMLWRCDNCNFAFSTEHEDEGGGFSCPLCAETKLSQQLAQSQAEVERLSQAIKWALPNLETARSQKKPTAMLTHISYQLEQALNPQEIKP